MPVEGHLVFSFQGGFSHRLTELSATQLSLVASVNKLILVQQLVLSSHGTLCYHSLPSSKTPHWSPRLVSLAYKASRGSARRVAEVVLLDPFLGASRTSMWQLICCGWGIASTFLRTTFLCPYIKNPSSISLARFMAAFKLKCTRGQVKFILTMQLYYDQVVKDTVYRAGFAQYAWSKSCGGRSLLVVHYAPHSPYKMCLSPNPLYQWNRVFANVIKLRWGHAGLGWALIQPLLFLEEERRLDTEGRLPSEDEAAIGVTLP